MAPRTTSHLTSSIPSGSGLAHVLHVLHRGLALGIDDHPLEGLVVPRLVDEAGSGSLELVVPAAGAPDLDLQVVV